ncbi:hypothetical protein ABBQ32_013496 [Trebouxia sp. C0010 RCD-2024]
MRCGDLIGEKHRHEMCVDEVPQQMGRRSCDNTRSRPVRIKFGTLRGKHLFLKHAKVLRQAGFRLVDDLTWLQQEEQKSADAEFKALKSKGYSPFFRGSQLQYFHAEKMHTCRKGTANSIPYAFDLKAVKQLNTVQKTIEEIFSGVLANFEANL